MTVFLAGATGVLGRALIPRLVVRGHRVRAIARRRPPTRLPEGVEFSEADLLTADLRRLVDGCDAVIHIATAIPSDPSVPGAWDDNTRLRTSGTRRLLAAALASGASRYVQQSIVTAYRAGGDAWLDEQAPLDDSPARATVCGPVIEMETMIREVEPQALAWTILRGGSFVGEGTRQFALLDQLRDGTVVAAGDGSNYVSLVDVADMAAAVTTAVEAAPAGSTFNVVDDPLRYGDYVDALADLIGVSRPARAPKLPLPPSWRCTNRAARTALGWMPHGRIWPYPNAA
ncbi:MAG TPA: NAD(P)-dependent oxidoreductase [Gaiellaceae bacterium]|nr:NAD(P)-dependent oxidoreductase [Gaiellaceae bacterium]